MAMPDTDDQFASPNILVVEDDPSIRLLLAEELRDAGFVVIEAASADEALEYFLSHQPVDLVFTDVQMPGSIDGLELARRLHGLAPALPLIVTSGAIGRDTVDPAFRYIAKPYRMDDVRELVRSALNLPSRDHA